MHQFMGCWDNQWVGSGYQNAKENYTKEAVADSAKTEWTALSRCFCWGVGKKKWCKKHPKSEISKCPPWPLPCPSAVSTSPMQPLLHTLRRQGHVPWLGGQIQSCWVFVCRWLPHDAGALTIPVHCPSKAWQMRVDDAIGFHRSQSLKVLQNITQDQWLTVLMSLLTSRSCGQVAFHSVGPLFKAALDSPKHKSHQDKRVLTRIGNRKIWDQVLSKGPA